MATVAAAAIAGTTAPAASAADDCPNAAVRAQQQSQHLPNCMAYEKVTPADKGGAVPEVALTWTPADGNAVFFSSKSAAFDGAMSGMQSSFRAMRSADGWATTVLAPAVHGRLPLLYDAFDGPWAWTSDLSRGLFQTEYPQHPNDQGTWTRTPAIPRRGMKDLYRREADGSFTWIVPDPSVVDTRTATADRPVAFAGASSDLERIAVQTIRSFDSRVPATNTLNRVYLWTASGTHLVSVLPNGDLPSGAAGLQVASQGLGGVTLPTPAVSGDARRVAFWAANGSTSQKPYLRIDADDPVNARTVELTRSDGAECLGGSNSFGLLTLSRDGTKVLYSCSGTLYLREVDGGPAAVQELGPARTLTNPGPEDAGFRTAADLSLIYGRGPESSGGITVWRDGVPSTFAMGWDPLGSQPANVSTDGEYFAFESRIDALASHPAVPGSDPGAASSQVYLYSARTGKLSCVSCRPDGAPTDGAASFDSQEVFLGGTSTPVSERGTVVFSSTSALVPQDSNGVEDAYAWVDGRPVLLSGGHDAHPSAVAGSSMDGSTFFLQTSDALVRDDVDGGQYDLYAVRVNGGRLVSDPVASCVSACRRPGPERPGAPAVGTGQALPNGNLVETVTAGRASVSVSVPRSVRGTSVAVRVRVSRPGRVRISGVGLRSVTRTVNKASTVRVPVRLSAHGARQQRTRGRLATRISTRLSPTATGTPVTVRRSVTFVPVATKKGGR